MEWFMVEVVVSDWVRSLAWYRDVLKADTELIDEARGFVLLRVGGCVWP